MDSILNNHFDETPEELITVIAKFLLSDIPAIINFSMTCKKFKHPFSLPIQKDEVLEIIHVRKYYDAYFGLPPSVIYIRYAERDNLLCNTFIPREESYVSVVLYGFKFAAWSYNSLATVIVCRHLQTHNMKDIHVMTAAHPLHVIDLIDTMQCERPQLRGVHINKEKTKALINSIQASNNNYSGHLFDSNEFKQALKNLSSK